MTTHATEVFQALQAVLVATPLNDIDESAIRPVVSINAEKISESVVTLWKAMRSQSRFLELMEKEMARRKTETEVRLKTMQNEMEGQLQQEARRRSQELDKVRGEQKQQKAELEEKMEKSRKAMDDKVEASQRAVDRAVAGVKVMVADMNATVANVREEMSELQKALLALQKDMEGVEYRCKESVGDVKVFLQQLYDLFGLMNADEIATAVKKGKQKEFLFGTPVFVDILERFHDGEMQHNGVMSDIRRLQNQINEQEEGRKKLGVDINGLWDNIQHVERAVREELNDVKRSLLAKIHAIENNGKAVDLATSLAVLEDRVLGISGEVKGIQQRHELDRRQTEDELLKKADIVALNVKADTTTMQNGDSALHKKINGLEKRIHEVSKHLTEGLDGLTRAGADPPGSAATRRRSSTPSTVAGDPEALDAIKDELQSMNDWVSGQLGKLDAEKASRNELNTVVQDIDRRMSELTDAQENEINDIRANQHQQSQQTQQILVQHNQQAQDTTAGRFRCISCNRDAGPLQGVISERSTKQFPPSNMYVKGHGGPAGAIGAGGDRRPSSAGGDDGSHTTSRKKLMNYYDWLRSKSGDPERQAQLQTYAVPNGGQQSAQAYKVVLASGGPGGQIASAGAIAAESAEAAAAKGRAVTPPGTTSSPRSKSPSRWMGAQSGGGEPGDRQCGDHGSPHPEAIGSDGRFYSGVESVAQIVIPTSGNGTATDEQQSVGGDRTTSPTPNKKVQFGGSYQQGETAAGQPTMKNQQLGGGGGATKRPTSAPLKRR